MYGLPEISDRIGHQDLVDLLLLSSVPVILTSVFLLPDGLQQGLALNREAPGLMTLFTAHYVHSGAPHFVKNLVVYVVTVVPAYFLCLSGGERRRFRVYFLFFVLALPFVLSPLDLLIFEAIGLDQGLSGGFSGIDAAFLGFLPITLFAFLRSRVNGDFEVSDSIVLFLIGLLMIPVSYWRGIASIVPIVGVTLIVAFFLRNILIKVGFEALRASMKELRGKLGYLVLVYLGLTLPTVGASGLFPSALVNGGNFVNIFAHYLGFVLGFLVPYTTWSRLSNLDP